MISLKDKEEVDSYIYKVCELSGCEDIAEDIYESDDVAIDVCYKHYRDLENIQYVS